MNDVVKLFLVWIGIPVIGALISCILGWIAIKIHKRRIKNETNN